MGASVFEQFPQLQMLPVRVDLRVDLPLTCH
jgi:hypothetical protein